MSESYPLPSYACSVWVAGDNLMVAFPATIGQKAHTVPFPNSERGLRAALTVLRARETNQNLSIGTRGAPPRAYMEDIINNDAKFKSWLSAMGEAKVDRAAAAEELKEFGL